ncbi:MlaA family lipoprotein, partial [Ottowia thiooxydans]|uniref:MlaA family lipoprotein n=1 Tax=Ottowia thiooxydans TaxID=219182 RepID=UPI0003F7AA9F
MRAFHPLLLTAFMLGTSACASNAANHPITAFATEEKPAVAMVAVSVVGEPATPEMPVLQGPVITAEPITQVGRRANIEDDSQTELNAGDSGYQAPIHDPWESFNRRVHSFNDAADRFVLRPVAIGYKKIMPEPVQTGISRFFANLGMPVTLVNQALQGRPHDAAKSLGRFAINTTLGIAGVFDPASRFGLPKRNDEDFGQTLATWGWSDSRYLVLPLLGPRTVRDTLAIVGDQPLSPITQIHHSGTASGLQALEIVDMRTRLLPIDQFRREALDDYLFIRNAWMQRRHHQIQESARDDRD